MRNENSTSTKELAAFSSIKDYERVAVMLRSEGKSYQAITNHINAEYALDYVETTVRGWFIAGGKLEQAYRELQETLARAALKEARARLMRAQNVAASVLIGQLQSPDERIKHDSAKSILNKYIPDKQITLEGEVSDDIPIELSEEGNKVVDEFNNRAAIDESRSGEGADKVAGTETS